ncbi:lytic murein transglycosylase [Rhodovulum iodosum]|uniref:Lytic murein transglycosylase n=1 Tax=Rhodovulum iodosum TaxID=68291 RepID=A0ABV3XTJ1_9RHOB|nr:lytic murein transglycosylase [Rhodovulum robiginosum]RSK39606.1 lytic murein transglycosylase [Rhodovulum robiginosum]
MKFALSTCLCLALALPAAAQVPCGGSFSSFVGGLKSEAARRGYDRTTIDRFFASARQDPAVIRADRAQGIFQRDFIDFSRRLISQSRIDNGRRNAQKWDSVFDAIERGYGVSRGVLLAFWALETDYGAVQGNFNTLNALVTLSHDCRRPHLFRPQIFAALELFHRGDFDPARTTGAWAGEIGMVQMLPEDILTNGVDGDGDGHVRLKTSPPDALMSGAKMLRDLGWRPNEPWLQEIVVPANLNWSETGLDHRKRVNDWARLGVRPRQGNLGPGNLPASVLLPMGRNGPAFLAYPNFNVYFEWNKSFVYVTTAAYFATRLEGAPIYDAGNPDPGLSGNEMRLLQRKLAARGHDVGGIDGILGAKTRAAVQAEQQRLGLPADAWPTKALLGAL